MQSRLNIWLRGVTGRSTPAPGSIIRRRILGSNAVYRVLREVEGGIRVEVLEAPGLLRGIRYTFAADLSRFEVIQVGTGPRPG